MTDKHSKVDGQIQGTDDANTTDKDARNKSSHIPHSSDSDASGSAVTSPIIGSASSHGVSASIYKSSEVYGGGLKYTFSLSDLLSGKCTFTSLSAAAADWQVTPPELKGEMVVESRRSEVERAVASGLFFNVLDFNASEVEYAAFLVLAPYLDIYGWTEGQLRWFVTATRSLYRNAPYHNWSHAVDVLQFASTVLHLPSVFDRFSRIEVATAIITALVHDIDHDGVTNRGHAALKSERASLSSQSTQEKHHLRIAWLLFERSLVASHLHKGIIDGLIDATDMHFHRKHVELLTQLVQSNARFVESESERLELLIIVMKSADLSNTVRLGATARAWGDRLGDEFSLAYQREVQANVPKDRSSFPNGDPTLSHDATQLSFYSHVLVPFYSALRDTPVFSAFYAPFVTNATNGVKHFSTAVQPEKAPQQAPDLAP